MLEKTLESPLDCKEIQPVRSKGNQPWMFIGRTDAKAEASILWPPDAKSQLIGKDPDAEKDWRQVEKGMAEDKMVGWHHWLNGYECEKTPGDIEGPGSLACCSPWDHRVRNDLATEQQHVPESLCCIAEMWMFGSLKVLSFYSFVWFLFFVFLSYRHMRTTEIFSTDGRHE